MENNILVSVIMTTYNHANYIEQAIRSVLMQKVNFKYEVLIGEDCSTDNTRQVLINLQEELPDNFKIYFREYNMGRKGLNNSYDLYSRAKGKYIIALEGDDFWTYNLKLQRQVDFLEHNPDYVAISHNTKVVDANRIERMDYIYPECKDEEYTFENYRHEILAGQTTTILRRNPNINPDYKDIQINIEYAGDQKTNYILLCNGRVKCIQKKWSAYRYIPESGSSYSATHKEDKEFCKRRLIFFKSLVEFARSKVPTNIDAIRCIESIYLYYLLKDIYKKADIDSTIIRWLVEFKSVNSHLDSLKYILERIIFALKKHLIIRKNN